MQPQRNFGTKRFMMKKTIYAFVAALAVLGSLAAISTTLEGDRIAYINSETLIEKMTELPAFKVEMDKLEVLSKQYEANLKAMQETYEKDVKEFEANEKLPASNPGKWSAFIKELHYNDIMELEQKIKKTQQYYQYDLADKQNKMYVPIVQRYKKVVEEVAKENGYTVVIEYNGIIYASKDKKLTRKVAQRLGVTYTEEDEQRDDLGFTEDPLQGAGQ